MSIRSCYEKSIIFETFSSHCSVPSGHCKNMSMWHGTVNSRYQKIKFLCFERHRSIGLIQYRILIHQKARKKYDFIWKTEMGNLDYDFSIYQAQLSHGHDWIKSYFFPGMIILVIFLSQNINGLNTNWQKKILTALLIWVIRTRTGKKLDKRHFLIES